MKTKNGNHTLAIVAGLAVGLVLAQFIWAKLPQHRYQQLVSNTGLLNAFLQPQLHDVDKYVHSYHLDYQHFTAGRLTYSSNTHLPIPTIVRRVHPLPGVIQPGLSSLTNIQPYTTWMHGQPYIFFSLVNPENSDNIYIIYSRVLP